MLPPATIIEEEPQSRARLPGVLFVDDDPQVRRAFVRIMQRAHIPTTTAESAEEALEMLQSNPSQFGVIATDYYMPGKTGVDLLQAAAICSPWSARILVSGQLAVEPLLNAINQCGVAQVVTKPWRARELERAVRRALDRANLALRNAVMLDQLKDQNRDLRRRAEHEGVDELMRARPFCERLAFAIEQSRPPNDRYVFRTAAFARITASAMGLPSEQQMICELGALVHDLGKLLPDDSDAEAMESGTVSMASEHPETGYALLATLPGLEPVAQVVRQHHERFDGLGFPQGLEGADICVGARVFRLASALVRTLASRAPVDVPQIERALRDLAHDRGTQFDPAVVDAAMAASPARWAAAYHGFPDDN